MAKPAKKAAAPTTETAKVDVSPHSGGKTVTVACKLPHGLILRLFEQQKARVPLLGRPGETVEEVRAVQIGESVTINGSAVPYGQIPSFRIVGGYALTSGVNADFFERWLEQNASLSVVKEGLVFAQKSDEHAAGQANEQKALRSGLEPLDVSKGSKDPRMKGVEKVQKFNPKDDADVDAA